jgi:hypothetical protein
MSGVELIKKLPLKQKLEKNYELKNHTLENLKSLGFYRYSPMCDDETTYYIYRFPIYKHLRITTLECELKVCLETGEIRIDLYDMNYNIFPMFYNNDYINNIGSENILMKQISKNIHKEFISLGIRKKGNKNGGEIA